MPITESQLKANKKYADNNKEKIKLYQKKYADNNKEKKKLYQKLYQKKYADNNKEKIKLYQTNNKEKILIQQQTYKNNNREKINAAQRMYRNNNKEKVDSCVTKAIYKRRNTDPEYLEKYRHDDNMRRKKANAAKREFKIFLNILLED